MKKLTDQLKRLQQPGKRFKSSSALRRSIDAKSRQALIENAKNNTENQNLAENSVGKEELATDILDSEQAVLAFNIDPLVRPCKIKNQCAAQRYDAVDITAQERITPEDEKGDFVRNI